MSRLTPYIPGFIRRPLRAGMNFLTHVGRWMRAARIRREQNRLLPRLYGRSTRKLVVFVVPGGSEPGKGTVGGGILSLVSLCNESARLRELHGAEVIMCVFPGDWPLLKFDWFENDRPVFRFDQLRSFFKDLDWILIHVPEYLSARFLDVVDQNDLAWFQRMSCFHVNVANQNIQLMPPTERLTSLARAATRMTVTTAHKKYCSLDERSRLGVPLHHFSATLSKYNFRDYAAKENLLVYSPDPNPMRERVLQELRKIPDLKCVEIRDMSYEQYKSIISRAKWSVTFGEGLDGYFVEPIMSGAISFAAYNEEFFTPAYQSLATVYQSFDVLIEKIAGDIRRLDRPHDFATYQQEQRQLCKSDYRHEEYLQNISRFYQGDFTFP